MDRELVARLAVARGFKRKGRTNFIRHLNDVLQLVNLQRSMWSDLTYVNFAVWPDALGEPERIAEHLFPLRARIETVLGDADEAAEADPERFFDAIDARFSSFDAIRTAHAEGRLKAFAIGRELGALLTS